MKKIISFVCLLLAVVTAFSVCVSAYSFTQAPRVESITPAFSSVKIDWEDYKDSTYQMMVYRSDSGKKGTWKKLTTTKEGVTSYTDKTVTPNKTYFYTIKAYKYYKNDGLKFVSDMSYVYKVVAATPRPYFNLVGNGGKGVVLKWDTGRDMSGVVIYRSASGKKGTWSKIKTIKNAKTSSYTDSNVLIGETYYYCYKVYKTVNGKNYYSQASKAYKSTILDVSTPGDLRAIVRDDGIEIRYTKSLGTIGYVIYRSDTGKKGTWSRVKVTTSNNTLSFVDKTAVEGNTYYYTVKSYKKVSGETYYSEPAKSVKVVNRHLMPEVSFVGNDSITFEDYYEEIEVRLLAKNVLEDEYFRVFLNGKELTDELADNEEKLAELLDTLSFFFYIDEEKTTDDELVLVIYRLSPGEGTLKFQHCKYDDVSAELKINCPEIEYDKDLEKANEILVPAYEKVEKAIVILKEDFENRKGGSYVAEHPKADEAKSLLESAKKDFEDVKSIIMKYEADYSKYEGFNDDVELLDKYIHYVDKFGIMYRGEDEVTNLLDDAIEMLERIIK